MSTSTGEDAEDASDDNSRVGPGDRIETPTPKERAAAFDRLLRAMGDERIQVRVSDLPDPLLDFPRVAGTVRPEHRAAGQETGPEDVGDDAPMFFSFWRGYEPSNDPLQPALFAEPQPSKPEPIESYTMRRENIVDAGVRKGLVIGLGALWVLVLVAQIVLALALSPENWVKVGVALGGAGQTVGTFLGLVVGYYFKRD